MSTSKALTVTEAAVAQVRAKKAMEAAYGTTEFDAACTAYRQAEKDLDEAVSRETKTEQTQ